MTSVGTSEQSEELAQSLLTAYEDDENVGSHGSHLLLHTTYQTIEDTYSLQNLTSMIQNMIFFMIPSIQGYIQLPF